MKMKRYKHALTLAGVAGLAMVSSVNAATFQASAEIQNALTVIVVQEMGFGTIFATNAVDATDTNYSTLVLLADGSIDTGNSYKAPTIPLLSLGGATAARGSIAVSSTTAVTVTLPDHISSTINTTAAGDAYASTGTPIELRIGGSTGDPNVARFEVVDFTLGDVVGGTDDGGTANVYVLTPSFGSTDVEFGIGATLVTDPSGSRTTYESGTYTGTFEVTASY